MGRSDASFPGKVPAGGRSRRDVRWEEAVWQTATRDPPEKEGGWKLGGRVVLGEEGGWTLGAPVLPRAGGGLQLRRRRLPGAEGGAARAGQLGGESMASMRSRQTFSTRVWSSRTWTAMASSSRRVMVNFGS